LSASRIRVLAIHLPQFHPIPENDAWWGPGFTEWTNVTRALPRYPGHRQPNLPSELGFYDLRVPEVRQAQADLARAHGIDGFVYYHYWFHGRKLLHQPVEAIVSSGRPDFPFCLCWANEHWTRSWTPNGAEMLVEQTYSADDDDAHIEYLLQIFADPRYIKVDGKPVLFMYRASKMPDAGGTFQRWRDAARKAGFPGLYLIRFESSNETGDPAAVGCDAAAEFQPDKRLFTREFPEWLPMGRLRKVGVRPFGNLSFQRYERLVDAALNRGLPSYKFYRCVMPSWDNTPRRPRAAGGGLVVIGSTPQRFERWLSGILRAFQPYSPDENIVLVNAWNEWAEGNHLEPGVRWGRQFLEATARAIAAR
jgi:lipopolysaccharide biosynthesis protein